MLCEGNEYERLDSSSVSNGSGTGADAGAGDSSMSEAAALRTSGPWGRRPFALWATGPRSEYLGSACGTSLGNACDVLAQNSPWFREGFAGGAWRGRQIVEGYHSNVENKA